MRRRTGHSPDPWQLALVQRSLVWDEVRIARLLDSLLAGYPIGRAGAAEARPPVDRRGAAGRSRRRLEASSCQMQAL